LLAIALALVAAVAGAASPGASKAQRGLVAAYDFEERAGATVTDASGHGNVGTISGATRTTSGRYGRALVFDGRDDFVTVADSASLDLTNGMTLEAWVRPTDLGDSWRTAVIKEQSNALAYALYAHTGGRGPSGHAHIGGSDRRARADVSIAADRWTHLAVTFDGSSIRLYRDGSQILSESADGGIATSGGPLRVGGTGLWREWFAGTIDEVRVYNRPLTAGEIGADMRVRAGAPATRPNKKAGKTKTAVKRKVDRRAPTAPSRLVRRASTRTSVTLAWRGSRDNTRVTGYGLYRNGKRVKTIPRRTGVVRRLRCGTRYTFAVDARDATGNRSRKARLRARTAACAASPTPPSTPRSGAASVYVSTSGSDSSPCSASAPCRGFDRAYRVARPGEIIEVGGGTYERQTIEKDSGKTAAEDVLFRPAAGASVTLGGLNIRGSHVEIRDMRLAGDGAVGSDPIDTRDVTLRNITGRSLFLRADDTRVIGGSYGGFNGCESGAPEDGVKLWSDSNRGADGIVLDGVRIHDIRRTGCDRHTDCIQIYSGTNHTIKNSTLVNCPTTGIIARPSGSSQKLENITIENNYFGPVLDGSEAINIGTAPDRCSGIVIRHNTVVNDSSSFDCRTAGGAAGSLVEGNIIRVGGDDDAVFRFNVFRPGSARPGIGAIGCSPAYRNAAAGDWRLAAGDRCARGRGNPSSHPATDAEGEPRPQGTVDAGADEVQ
jgi:hypothetical protein